MKNIKIFVGTRETSGYFGALKEGFRNLGYYCKFYDFYSHHFSYGLDDNNESKLIKTFVSFIDKIEKNKLKGIVNFLAIIFTYILAFIVFIICCIKFNIFIFYSNSGFWRLKPWDYYILKLLRKKIIFVSLGTDIRPPYLNGKFIYNKRYSLNSIYKETQKILKKINRMESVADYIISYPAHSQLLNKKFINGLIIGNPAEINLLNEKELNEEEKINNNILKPIRILHAPSHPETKGTYSIRKVIEQLKEKGYAIEYIEIMNKPHSEVLKQIKNCDFVIDQLYSDTPLPLFAVEAGLYKKPPVVAGYYSDFVENDITDGKFFSLFIHPDKLFELCEKLCSSKEFRYEMGNKIYKFLMDNWSKTIIAKRFLKLIEGNFSENWWFDPLNIKYWYGYGVAKKDLYDFLIKYTDKFSFEGLYLSKNKVLLKNIESEIKNK